MVTDCPVYKELGIKDGINGYIFDFDLSNADVAKIYNEIPSDFNFVPPKDRWNELLAEGESQYLKDAETMVKVVAIINYFDIELQKMKYTTDPPYEMNKARAEELEGKFIKIVES